MNKQQQLVQIRARKLGLLMLDARNSRSKSIEETASAIAVSSDQLAAYEKGEQSPSLPVLEALAYFLDVPLEQFWGTTSLSGKGATEAPQQMERLRQIRDRIIGASLKMHRTQLNFSFQEISAGSGISEDILKKYELGEISVPLPELELLAKTYDVRVEDFFDQKGAIAKWRAQQIAIRQFLELPSELQDFTCKPVNQPYLRLALRLSDLSVDKLRRIAESLLEITY